MSTTIEGIDFGKVRSSDRVTFRGYAMTARTAAAVLAKEDQAGMTAPIVQGGYNPGGVGASGGTHDADGCVDWSVAGMSKRQKRKWVHAGRDVGWCDWHRPTLPGEWAEHNHGALDKAARASATAKAQWPDYHNLGNGLWPLTGGDDPDPYRPHPAVEFSYAAWVADLKRASRVAALRADLKRLVRKLKATRRRVLARRRRINHLTHS